MRFKICYIWIRDYRNFKNFGFNLSSTVKFDFDVENFKLSRKEINNVPKNFFGYDISDVVGFIGKNGTGKSNLLELVCKLVKGGKTSVDSDFVIITKDNNEYKCYYRFENYLPIESTFSIELLPYSGEIKNLKVIYFSNVYDGRKQFFDRKVSDLSANNRYPNRIVSRSNKTSDFVKQFQFIRSEVFQHSEIPEPEKIVISPKYNIHNTSYWKRRIFSNESLNKKFNEIWKKYYYLTKNLRLQKDKLYYFLLYTIIHEILSYLISIDETKESIESNSIKIVEQYVEMEKNDIRFKNFAALWKEWCNNIIRDLSILQIQDFGNVKKKFSEFEDLKKYFELLNRYNDFIGNKVISFSVEGSRNRKTENHIIEFNSSQIKLDEDFYNFIDWTGKLNIDWLGLSSGHKAYLDIFSLIRYDLKSIRITENVLICVDEGDLYLHPKWQAEFFYKLVNLIPQFKDANYQFVLTSHSPFLVSDLPKQNLVFLGRNSDNITSDINNDDNVKTFAGNLGELYIDAFFMDGSLISRFAANKIQEVIDKLNNNLNLTQEDEKLVDLIGDDFIRIQIQNLRNGKN